MTTVRRGLLVVTALVVTIVLALAVPAQATFTARAVTPTAGVTTITVQPPTGLSTAGSYCDSDNDLHLKLSWTKSATPRVSSYRVRAYTLFGINVTVGTVSATTTGVTADLGSNYFGYAFSVTTTTDYGWTAESAQTGTFRC